MALKEVLKYLKQPDAVTPVTPEKITGLQSKLSIYAASTRVTPVTPHFVDTQGSEQLGRVDEASNKPEQPTDKPSRQSYQEWVQTWQPLVAAYHLHHSDCPTCVAAGKGYGLRCGAGAALWSAYEAQP